MAKLSFDGSENLTLRANAMAQQMKAFATNLDDLSLTSRILVVEGENLLLKVVL